MSRRFRDFDKATCASFMWASWHKTFWDKCTLLREGKYCADHLVWVGCVRVSTYPLLPLSSYESIEIHGRKFLHALGNSSECINGSSKYMGKFHNPQPDLDQLSWRVLLLVHQAPTHPPPPLKRQGSRRLSRYLDDPFLLTLDKRTFLPDEAGIFVEWRSNFLVRNANETVRYPNLVEIAIPIHRDQISRYSIQYFALLSYLSHVFVQVHQGNFLPLRMSWWAQTRCHCNWTIFRKWHLMAMTNGHPPAHEPAKSIVHDTAIYFRASRY